MKINFIFYIIIILLILPSLLISKEVENTEYNLYNLNTMCSSRIIDGYYFILQSLENRLNDGKGSKNINEEIIAVSKKIAYYEKKCNLKKDNEYITANYK